MPDITLTIGANTKTKTLTTEETQRLINAFKSKYGQVLTNPADPNSALRDRTNAELFDLYWRDFTASLRALVRAQEEQTARLAIVDPPIN